MAVKRYRDAIHDALRAELLRDPRVMLIGEDLRDPWGGTYKCTEGLSPEFGADRILNTPIAEGGIIGAALGAALTGLRPVAELMYWDFAASLAMDQIINQVTKIRYMTGGQVQVPLVIRGPQGGYKRSAAQHGQTLEAWFAHIPGAYVVTPSTPYDAKGLLKEAIRVGDPVLFFEHKNLYMVTGEVPDEDYTIPLGVADIKRHGTDVTVVANGRMVLLALEAAEQLAAAGISIEIVDPRTLVPLDEATIIRSVARTHRLVVVNEGHERCGWAGEIVSLVCKKAFDELDAPPLRVAARNVPLPFAPIMEDHVLPSVEDIVAAVRSVMEGM